VWRHRELPQRLHQRRRPARPQGLWPLLRQQLLRRTGRKPHAVAGSPQGRPAGVGARLELVPTGQPPPASLADSSSAPLSIFYSSSACALSAGSCLARSWALTGPSRPVARGVCAGEGQVGVPNDGSVRDVPRSAHRVLQARLPTANHPRSLLVTRMCRCGCVGSVPVTLTCAILHRRFPLRRRPNHQRAW